MKRNAPRGCAALNEKLISQRRMEPSHFRLTLPPHVSPLMVDSLTQKESSDTSPRRTICVGRYWKHSPPLSRTRSAMFIVIGQSLGKCARRRSVWFVATKGTCFCHGRTMEPYLRPSSRARSMRIVRPSAPTESWLAASSGSVNFPKSIFQADCEKSTIGAAKTAEAVTAQANATQNNAPRFGVILSIASITAGMA